MFRVFYSTACREAARWLHIGRRNIDHYMDFQETPPNYISDASFTKQLVYHRPIHNKDAFKDVFDGVLGPTIV
jgi:hypothetical protein